MSESNDEGIPVEDMSKNDALIWASKFLMQNPVVYMEDLEEDDIEKLKLAFGSDWKEEVNVRQRDESDDDSEPDFDPDELESISDQLDDNLF